MRFIIYGAGAVGCVIGAQLALAGIPATLIARGAHLAALQARGLDYQTPNGAERIAVNAVGHPAEIEAGADDVVILTCKSQHTVEVLGDLRNALGDRLPVVCCQNGVANEREALRRFAQVHAMLVYLPAQLLEPGVVHCHSKYKPGVLDLGRYPDRVDANSERIAAALETAGFSARPRADVMRFKYAKLLMNLNNAVEAVLPEDADRAAYAARARDEARACLQAAGIDHATHEEVRERRAGIVESGDIPGVQRAGGSTRQSLLRGTGDIEADFLNGEITLLGRLHGVPTPVNQVFAQLANELARDRAAPGSIAVSTVEQRLAVAGAGT